MSKAFLASAALTAISQLGEGGISPAEGDEEWEERLFRLVEN
jgi:hypothetical protein